MLDQPTLTQSEPTSPRLSNWLSSNPQNLDVMSLTFGTLKNFVVAVCRRKFILFSGCTFEPGIGECAMPEVSAS